MVALLACAVFLSSPVEAQPWIPAGPDDGNQASYLATNQTALASDKAGGFYVGYAEDVWISPSALLPKASVRHWNGSSWQQVGMQGFSAGQYRSMQIAVAPGPVPYIVFKDFGAARKAVVKTFNGTAWVDVGGGTVSPGATDYTSIALDASGMPYVAYTDSLAAGSVTVKKWTGTTWQTVGNATFSPTKAFSVKIAIGGSGIPQVLVLYNTGTASACAVFRLSGTTWQSLGSPVSSPATVAFYADGADLAISTGDTAYVAITDNTSNRRVNVRKYAGTGWVTVGSPNISPSVSAYVRLLIDTAKGTYLSCQSYPTVGQNNPTYPMIRRFNGTDWAVVGPDSFVVRRNTTVPGFCLDTSGTPHILFGDPYYRSKLLLRKLSGGSWNILGRSDGFTGGPGASVRSAASPDGKKAYTIITTSVAQSGVPASVYRYDTGWTQIGQSGSSGWSGVPIAIAVHPDGNPWIVVRDSANFLRTNVWRYTSSGWVNTFLNDSVGSASLTFDGAGTAYLAYLPFYGGGLQIRKYHSSTGMITFSTSPYAANQYLGFVRIVTNRAGVPHLLAGHYSSSTYPQYVFEIFRYTGSGWASLGGIFNSAMGTPSGGTPDLAFDTSDIPHIAYINGSQSGFKVQRFNAPSYTWIDILAGSGTLQKGYDPRIQFSQDGSLFLSYMDRSTRTSGSPTVQRFTGTGWQTIGSPSFSKTYSGDPELMLLNNKMLVTFSDGAPFAYKFDCSLPVAVVRHPSDLVACAGGRAEFNTSATGATAYRWQMKSGQGWTNLTDGSGISGAVSGMLSLTTIPAVPDTTFFRCVFTNACGTTVIGEPAMMILAPSLAPTVTVSAIPGTILSPGQTVTFTANVTNGGIAPQYEWLLNGSPVSGEISPSFTTNTLVNGDSVAVRTTRSDTCTIIRTVTSAALTIQVSLGIGSTGSQQKLTIYPQPVHSVANISGHAGMPAGKYRITVHSATGQLVLDDAITLTGTAWTHRLMLPALLPSGLYRLTLQGSELRAGATLSIVR